MNLRCRVNGHLLGTTLLFIGGHPDADDPSVNYEVRCRRCEHVVLTTYGTRPDGFGPRVVVRWPLSFPRR